MIVHTLPEIDRGIWKALDAKPAPKRKQKRAGCERGAQPKNNKIPDETILAMRRMHEIERKSFRQVQAAYPEISEVYVRAILNYISRATLRVRP